MFVWRAVSEEGSGVWLGEQAGAFPCVAALTEPEKLDNGMMLSLRMPRAWQKGERAHASLSPDCQTKPCSRISQEYLFLVWVTERNMVCFYSASWIAVVKMTARTRADPCVMCPSASLLCSVIQQLNECGGGGKSCLAESFTFSGSWAAHHSSLWGVWWVAELSFCQGCFRLWQICSLDPHSF